MMMKVEARPLLSRAIVLAILCCATAHAAEESRAPLGKGTVVISMERLVGFAYASTTQGRTPGSIAVDSTGTAFGRLGSGATSYVTPRVGVDVFIAKGLTAGAAVGYFRGTLDNNIPAEFAFQPREQIFRTLVLAPRVGYFAALGRSLGLWPRLGFTYVRSRSSGDTSSSVDLYALTVEVPVALRIADHLMVTAGASLDLGLGGSFSTNGEGLPLTPSRGLKETDVGVTAAFAGYF